MPKQKKHLKVPKKLETPVQKPSSRPAPAKGALPLLASLLLLALAMSFTFQPALRLLRLWSGQDGFQHYKLTFTMDGVPAEWGYACWTGPFLDEIKNKFKDYNEKAITVTYTAAPLLNQNINGGPLSIGGKAFTDGIGSHAPSKIAFSLQGKFSRFSCLAGLDATSSRESQGVIYSVLADGREIFKSPKLKADADPFPIEVSVAGVKELILYADNVEFNNTGSNIDWVNLKFIP
jgi:hypothetical protein